MPHEITERILFVDDDSNVLFATERRFHRQFDTETALSGPEALNLMRASGPFAVVVSDLRMVGMNGIEFLAMARQISPESVYIILTGYADTSVAIDAVNRGGIFRFLIKPCSDEILAQTLQDAVAQYRRSVGANRYTYSVLVRNSRAVGTEYSQGCHAVTGYSPQDYASDAMLWWFIVLPECRSGVEEHGRQILGGKDVGPIEYQIRRRDGRIRWLRDTTISHRDEQDRVIRYDGLIEDVTDQKEAAEALREREEFNKALFEYNPVQTIVVDREGKITTYNLAKKGCGDRLPRVGEVMFRDYAGKYEIDMYGELIRCINTGRSKTFSGLRYREKFFSTTVSPFPKGAIIISEDVTERKKAEEKIEGAAKEWRETFDSISDMVTILDRDFRIMRVNKAFADALNMQPKEVIGKRCFELVHQTRAICPNCPHKTAMETKRPAATEIFEPQWNKYYEVSVSPIMDDASQITGTVHIMKDITERKNAEEQLKSANEKLKENDRLKDEFVSTVSHELRTPLSIFRNIISNALAGVMGKISPKLQESFEIADENISRLSRIIGDFLDISKIEAGRMELNLRKVDLTALVAGVVSSFVPLAKEKCIELQSVVTNGELPVNADRDRIAQVLTNLIGNAVKFTPDGGHIKVSSGEREGEILIQVQDDGPGIDQTDQKKIFERFVQGKIAGSEKRGTGLGLHISRELIEMHHGRIWVESELGKGAKFCVALPKYEKHVDTQQQEPVKVNNSAV